VETIYDFVTVAIFVILVGYYVFLSDRRPRLLWQFLLSTVVIAVADEVGNFASKGGSVGMHALAIVLIVAGAAYAAIAARG
jgi:hypothetical protein